MLSACFGAFKAPSSATTSYNSAVMVNPTTKVLTSPSASDLGNANRFLMYDENRNVTVSSLFSSTASITGNATFSSDVRVQQNLNADTITETGGGINATLGGITASTLSAQAATFSSLTLSPTRWYAVFVLTPPARYLVNGALIHGSTSIGATSTISRAQYKDFVLKGAVQTGSSIRNRVWDVKFVYTSADPGQTVHTQMHAHMPDVYYTRSDYETYDTRAWVKQGATAIGDDGSTRWDLGAWVVVVKETGDWFSPHNQALVWSWIPQDYSGNPPTDPSGRWVWSPVLPDYWTTTPPSF